MDQADKQIGEESTPVGAADKVSLELTELTFSNGAKVNTEGSQLVVLLGPNNCGKSEALKDIAKCAKAPQASTNVVDIFPSRNLRLSNALAGEQQEAE
jgi:ABC-type cobalamin/Fe3+-siderophores transport system ATPase subunit